MPVRKILIGAAIGVAGALLAFAGTRTSLLDSVENASYDLRVRASAVPAPPDTPIVLVEINESTIRGLEPVVGRWPWPRLVHATVIDFLKQAGAKVIAYDVLFGDHEGRSETIINGRAITGQESDEALATSVRDAGNVILLAETTAGELAASAGASSAPPELPGILYRPGPGTQHVNAIGLPFHEAAGVARGIGHNRLVKDANTDSARRMLPFIETQGAAIPSLGVAGALAFLEAKSEDVKLDGDVLRIGTRQVPVLHEPVAQSHEPSTQALLRFSAPQTALGVRAIYPTYSFFDVALSADNVLSGKPSAIPMSAFAGKLVFVGTTAAGLFDRYSSPFPGGVAGVELHATLADNIIAGRFMRRATTAVDVAWSVVLGVATGIGATLAPVAAAVLITVAIVAAFVWGSTVAVGEGVWVAAVMPSLGAALALFGGVAWRYVVEDREKRQIRQLFGRYVSRDVIDALIANPALATLGGQRREMTVLFSDIRGFTTASEASTPEAVVAQLNEYFGAMVEVLFRYGGTLDKFVGDMVMGLFGAPLPDARHADHAVLAALEMLGRLEALNLKWKAEGRPELQIGIGINSGDMIAGNIGAETAMSYTVIGDAVNLGSRLESLNKEYGTRILISDATRTRLTVPVETRFIGDVKVKGKTQAVSVYTVTGLREQD